MSIKLVYCDNKKLNSGLVAPAVYINELGLPVTIQVMKDSNGVIRRVVKNGNLNPISNFYLQGGNNAEQMISKATSKEIMEHKGGTYTLELSGGLDENKQKLPPRIVEVEFTFNEERGLSQHDPRAYDCRIIKDGTVARLEGEFTL